MKRISNLKEINGIWRCNYIHPITKKRVRHTLKTRIYEKALEMYQREYGTAFDQKYLGKATDKTLSELIDWCWDNYWQFDEHGADKKTRYGYMKAPIDKFGTVQAKTITKDQVRAFIAERILTVKKKSVGNEISSVGFAFNRAIEEGMLSENPFTKLGKRLFPKYESSRSRIGSQKEIGLLLGHSAGMLRAIVEFDLNSGLRKGQIENLKRTDVDWIKRTMTVECDKGGRHHVYEVPIYDRAMEILKSLPQDTEYIFTNQFSQKIPINGLIKAGFPRLVKRCGITDFKFHDLRHTFATELYRNTKNLKYVQEVLGHTDVKQTQTYLNLTHEDLAQYNSFRFGSVEHKNDTVTETEDANMVKVTDNQ
jgi:integrase